MPITRDEALEHVGYEWRMYRTVSTILEQISDEPDPVRDALVESLVVHARNLVEFFSYDSQGRDMREALAIDDVVKAP